MTNTRRIPSILSLMLCAIMACAATQGTSLLQQSADKIKRAASMYVTYTATADGHTSEGQLVLQGDMFTISSPQIKSWYDGKTQWTYATQIGEVNIITPTPEEVRQINPLAIIKTFSTAYTAKQLSATGGKTTMRLTAKGRNADITSADVTIDDKTLYPTRIVLMMSNNQKVTIDIKSINTGSKIPDSNFRFDKKRFPGVNVVDLR